MRKYKEFKDMWLGRQCRDGQCVALFREYTEGFHDTPILERLGADGGAEGLYTRFESDVGPVSRGVFERIAYKHTDYDDGKQLFPEPGDVVVFSGTPTNKWGHVGIMDSVNKKAATINVLEQNGIAALRGEKVKVKIGVWGMDRVLGWLRLKRLNG